MAYISPVLGNQLFVKISDGADPEVFSHPTLINAERGVTFSTNTAVDELVDLADMGAPAQTTRRVTSTDVKIDGAGMLNADDTKEWIEWAQSGEIKNVKIHDLKWTMTGPFVLTNFQFSGERMGVVTCQITLEQAGNLSAVATVTP